MSFKITNGLSHARAVPLTFTTEIILFTHRLGTCGIGASRGLNGLKTSILPREIAAVLGQRDTLCRPFAGKIASTATFRLLATHQGLTLCISTSSKGTDIEAIVVLIVGRGEAGQTIAACRIDTRLIVVVFTAERMFQTH